jgi:hypothetical protein
MTSGIPDYPWFGSIGGDDIAQGDIFEKLPVFLPPTDLAFDETGERQRRNFSGKNKTLL